MNEGKIKTNNESQSDYYKRSVKTHVDGTSIFKSDEDRWNEDEAARKIEVAWQVQLKRFGELSPIDWFAEQYGRVVGLAELKCRSHPTYKFKTVFLNVRKWLALTLASVGLGIPAIFIVRFTDTIMWIPLEKVNPQRLKIGGCEYYVKSRSDVEPLIEVPINGMLLLSQKPLYFEEESLK